MSVLNRNRLLYRAHANGMTLGDYVFIYYSWTVNPDIYEPWNAELSEHKGISEEEKAENRKAFYSYLQVSLM